MKKFRMIWFGELISSIGSGMTAFAVAAYVFQKTGSATWVSLAALLAFLPTILLSPLGGILADRYDRRLLMILGDSLSVIGLLYILIHVQIGHGTPGAVCIGVAISSIFASLLEPAYKATITDLVTEDEYAKASSMVQIAGSSKYLISPAIAGWILHVADIRMILVLDMATFFVTVAAVLSVRNKVKNVKPVANHKNMRQEFKEGMNCITGNKGVASLVVLMGFMCFFIAFLQTLMTPMVLTFADSKSLGSMESISAIGMLVGSLIIGFMKLHKHYCKVLQVSLIGAGVFMALAGTTTTLWTLVTYCILFFTALPFVNTCADVLIRKSIPNELQGRAWGMIGILTQIGYVAAYAVCGVLADKVFNPMLTENGILANSIGKLIGTGDGRGIGLMLILSGMIMVVFAFLFGKKKSIVEIERMEENELVHGQERLA